MANGTTPFSGNASAKFQQNLNRLPTGGDRIPAPRLLSISRQLESRAERGYSNRRSRTGSPVQRYTGRRHPPRPAENRSGARKRRNRLGPGRSPRADSPRTSESGLNAEPSRRHPSRSLRASISAPSPGGDPGRGFLHRVPREMGVAGRRLDLAVPEQLADHRKAHTGRQWRVCDARRVAGTAQPLQW